MIALLLWLWTSVGLQGALLWFGLGILLSLAGDVLLMISPDRFFIYQGMRFAFPKHKRGIRSHHPVTIVRMPVDGRVTEGMTPFHQRPDRMRMRDGNCRNSAQRADRFHRSIL